MRLQRRLYRIYSVFSYNYDFLQLKVLFHLKGLILSRIQNLAFRSLNFKLAMSLFKSHNETLIIKIIYNIAVTMIISKTIIALKIIKIPNNGTNDHDKTNNY